MKKKKSLARKFILAFVLVGILLCCLCVGFGYRGFVQSMQEQYQDMAYLVAGMVEEEILKEIDTEQLGQYVEAAKAGNQEECNKIMEDSRYQAVLEKLSSIRKSMDLTDVYVVSYTGQDMRSYKENDAESWKPLLYIFDCFAGEQGSAFSFGEKSGMNPDNRELFAEVAEAGKDQRKFIISNGDFGYNMSALSPILSENGEVVCIIGVELPMKRIVGATKLFVIRTMGITLLAIILIIICFVGYLYKSVVRPVNSIAGEVSRFGKSKDRTEESVDILDKIRTNDEIEVLAEQIGEMEDEQIAHVENIRKITAEKERIGAELNVATQIQADMLPRIFPPFPERKEFGIFASMTPAKEVGGDFYDFFLTDEDHLALVMADVSGKGVPAALFMVIAKTLIKNQAMMDAASPAKVLSLVNEQLCEGNEAELFVTVWIAVLELSTGKGIAANAGHEHPVIRRVGGEYELVTYRHSPAVAVMEGTPFREHEFELHPGDSLFVYTDGVPEATDANGTLFGTERMLEALNQNPDATPQECLEHVKNAVDLFVGAAPQFDDLTMLGLHYMGTDDVARNS